MPASILPLRLQVIPVAVEIEVSLIQPIRKQLNAVQLRSVISLYPYT